MHVLMGKNSRDRTPVARDLTPDDFVVELYTGRIQRPATKEHKFFATPFIAPYRLLPGTVGKTKNNIDNFGPWFGTDIDHGWTAEGLDRHFADYWRVIYNTTSSRPGDERLRAIFRLSRDYTFSEYLPLWHAFNRLLNGIVDPATKNENRILYVAALWEGAANDFRFGEGAVFDVDELIASVSDLKLDEPGAGGSTGRGGGLDAIEGIAAGDPNNLLTPGMIDRMMEAPEGQRFYRLLCGIAAQAVDRGIAITSEELAGLGLEVDRLVTGKNRPNSVHEARNALGWAAKAIVPRTSLQRIQERLMRKQFMKEQKRNKSR